MACTYHQELVLLSVVATRYSGRQYCLTLFSQLPFCTIGIEGNAFLTGPVKDGAVLLV